MSFLWSLTFTCDFSFCKSLFHYCQSQFHYIIKYTLWCFTLVSSMKFIGSVEFDIQTLFWRKVTTSFIHTFSHAFIHSFKCMRFDTVSCNKSRISNLFPFPSYFLLNDRQHANCIFILFMRFFPTFCLRSRIRQVRE